MNRLTFRRMRGEYELDMTYDLDLAMPVVDGVALHELMGDRFFGIGASLVLPPARHLLGKLVEGEYGRTVLLDGDCLHAPCWGVMAKVIVGEHTVRWIDFAARSGPDIAADTFFEFDRQQYEAALASLDTVPIEPMPQSEG
jgi:hypothetical protein